VAASDWLEKKKKVNTKMKTADDNFLIFLSPILLMIIKYHELEGNFVKF
jgi:hypothetical protein